MSMAIQMQTSTSAGGQQGGFLGALGRAVAGGTLFMTEYTAAGGPGLLAFAAKLPGQILPLEIAPNQGYMVHRHGFMCATPGVQFSIGFQQRLGAGIFGGTGFRTTGELLFPGRGADFLDAYNGLEAEVEKGPFRRYRAVLTETARRAAKELSLDLKVDDESMLVSTIPHWPVFADVGPALTTL